MIKTFDFDFVLQTEKYLKQFDLENKRLGLAVSGGKDSCVLVDHFLTLKKRNPSLNISILHVHHGLVGDGLPEESVTNSYRNASLKLAQELSKKNKLTFFTNEVVKTNASSEEDLRNLRNNFFEELQKADLVDVIVTAHHQKDLLETRLIRLLRGSGPQGLESIRIFSENKFRPMLEWTAGFMEKYILEKKVEFIEDPSNLDSKYLRNWIRNVLFKSLEDYKQGSVENLSRSLELIAQALNSGDADDGAYFTETGIYREKLLLEPKNKQRQLIAKFIRKLNISDYTHTHIDEILKRLDSSQRELTFQILGLDWTVDTRHISAKKTGK